MKTKIINLTKELILITSFILLAVYCLASCDTYQQDCRPEEETTTTNKFVPQSSLASKSTEYPDLIVKVGETVTINKVSKFNDVIVRGNGQLRGDARTITLCGKLIIKSNARVEMPNTSILTGALKLENNSTLKAKLVYWYYELIRMPNAHVIQPTVLTQAGNGESLCNGGTLSMENEVHTKPVYVCD